MMPNPSARRWRIAASTAAWLAGVSAMAEQTSLLITPPELDLGDVPQHQLIEQSVILENRSPETVRVLEVRDSCAGCIKYDAGDGIIPPGESSILPLWIDPTELSGDQSIVVVVLTDQLDEPQRGIQVTARVLPSWRIEGLPVRFTQLVEDQQQTWRLKVIPRFQWNVPWTQVWSEVPGISGSLWFDENIGGYWVDIVAGPELSLGDYETELQLVGDIPGAPRCRIPVHVHCVPAISVAPKEIQLNPVAEEQALAIVVRQAGLSGGQPLRIEVPGDDFRFDVTTDPFYSFAQINLYARNLQSKSGRIGDVVIGTLHPDRPIETRIPVIVRDEVATPQLSEAQARMLQRHLGNRRKAGCRTCGS
jgi:hypothetical protein